MSTNYTITRAEWDAIHPDFKTITDESLAQFNGRPVGTHTCFESCIPADRLPADYQAGALRSVAVTVINDSPRIYAYETTSGPDWTRFIEEMHSGAVVEMDAEMYYYWLEALPPIYMGRVGYGKHSLAPTDATYLFGFAEGAEQIVDFWETTDKRYYCQQSNRINTREW